MAKDNKEKTIVTRKPESKDTANHIYGMMPSDNKWKAVDKKETIKSTDSRKKHV
jgi:hypothetical protein